MADKRFRIFVRHKPDAATGQMHEAGEIDVYTKTEAFIRYNAIGAWTMSLPANHEQSSLIRPGRGIAVFLGDSSTPVFSGPIRKIDLTWGANAAGGLVVSGPCDNVILGERIARADPRMPLIREGAATGTPPVPELFWDPVVMDWSGAERAPINTAEFIWGLVVENYKTPVSFYEQDSSRKLRYLQVDRKVPQALSALPADTLWKGFPIRMSNLQETVLSLATAAGLRVQFLWSPSPPAGQAGTGKDGIYLHITPDADRSESVVFGPEVGNLSGYTISSVAPEATRPVIAGESTPGDRRYYEVRKNDLFNPPGWIDWDSKDGFGNRRRPSEWSDTNWGREAIEAEWNVTAEKLVDARDINWPFQPDYNLLFGTLSPAPGSAVTAQIDSEALKFFVDNGPKGRISLNAIDIPDCRFGEHYGVGDVVRALLDTNYLPDSMRSEDGVIREQVREVKLSCSADAMWQIQPTVGTPDASETPWVYRELRRLRSKVESDASREELDPLAATPPTSPSLFLVRSGWDGGVTGYSKTYRPTAGQNYQLRAAISVESTDPRYVDVTKSDLTLEWSTDGYTWTAVPNASIKTNATANYWYYNHKINTVNVYHFWRARIVRSGATSTWDIAVPKFTVAAGALNTAGSLSLSTPSGVYRRDTEIKITGTDTTYGELSAEVEHSNQPGVWFGATSKPPTYTNNTFSIPIIVDTSLGLRVRVLSKDGDFNVVKTSNAITVNVET